MTSRDLFNRLAGCFGYAIEKKAKSRLGGRDLHEDANLILGRKSNPLILDLGANEGQSIRHFLHDFDQPEIISFEPCTKTFSKLQARFGHHPRVRLVHAAAGETNGEADLHIFERSGMNSIQLLEEGSHRTAMGIDELQVLQKERVKLVTLDSFCAENNIQQIDLLKMDCQGLEPGILRGATRLLQERRIKCLYLEVMFQRLYTDQGSLESYREFLKPFGMELTCLYKFAFRDVRLFHADVCFSLVDPIPPTSSEPQPTSHTNGAGMG